MPNELKKKVTPEGMEKVRTDKKEKYAKVDVFTGLFLENTVDNAIDSCPEGYEVYDMDVKYLNDIWVVIAKIREERDSQ